MDINEKDIEELVKSKRKHKLSAYQFEQKLLIMQLDFYLYSIEEAAMIFRMNRDKFVDTYIVSGLIPVTVMEDGAKKIKYLDMKQYLKSRERIYQTEAA